MESTISYPVSFSIIPGLYKDMSDYEGNGFFFVFEESNPDDINHTDDMNYLDNSCNEIYKTEAYKALVARYDIGYEPKLKIRVLSLEEVQAKLKPRCSIVYGK